MRKELGNARLSLDDCRQKGEQLGNLCGDPGLIEIRKQLEDIHHLADDVHDIARDREEDLKSALGHAEKFQQLQEVFKCHHLISFANSLDPDQAQQNVGPDLNTYCLN